MNEFKCRIDDELSSVTCDVSADIVIEKAEKSRKRIFTMPKVTAAAVALVLLAAAVFTPFYMNRGGGFVIIANAQTVTDGETSGDEITDESYVELKSDDPNYIFYNFNYILDADAGDTDLVRKYLFHSFNKRLDIKIQGDNIETITYKINNGSLTSCTFSKTDDGGSILYLQDAKTQSEIQISYDEQDKTSFLLNPIVSTTDVYNPAERYYALKNTGEIVKQGETTDKVYSYESGELLSFIPQETIGDGYMYDEPLATEEEITKLREYIENDDMVGFHNYQNQIFKRILEEITIDITVTKTNGKTETKTLELCYTPDNITKIPSYAYEDTQSITYSSGTLSAKVK